IDHIMQPEVQAALENTQSATLAAAPDPDEYPLSAQWARIRQESPIYTIQDQAFPKAVADSYFALQSEVLQGDTSPEQAARDMQQTVSDCRDSQCPPAPSTGPAASGAGAPRCSLQPQPWWFTSGSWSGPRYRPCGSA